MMAFLEVINALGFCLSDEPPILFGSDINSRGAATYCEPAKSLHHFSMLLKTYVSLFAYCADLAIIFSTAMNEHVQTAWIAIDGIRSANMQDLHNHGFL